MIGNSDFASGSTGQTIVLTGFVIAIIIIGVGTVLNSAAISGQQKFFLQSDETFDDFTNVREEYGTALMISSEYGDINPFNSSTFLLEFEDQMKTIMEPHGYFLNFLWTGESYSNESKTAVVTIVFSDNNKLFNDTVTYDLISGKIIYDTIPPGDIHDLYVTPYPFSCDDRHDGAVLLNWTATGDDGDKGTAFRYDIRYSNESIDDLDTFNNASRYYLGRTALESGQSEAHILDLIPPGDWYFAMIVYDEADNPSNLTQPVHGSEHAVASNWSARIEEITADNGSGNLGPYLTAQKNESITIAFKVSNEDKDTITVRLMMRNRTESGLTGNWFEAANWTNLDYSLYNNTLFSHDFNNGILEWDYFINASVYHPVNTCYQNTSTSSNISWDYYSIDYSSTVQSIILDWTFVNDTYIDETAGNEYTNYGSENLMKLDGHGSDIKFGLIKFNLSIVPDGATIIHAILSLFDNSSSSEEIYFYTIDSSWDEMVVNWSSGLSFNATESTHGISNLKNYTNWTVTSDANYFLHNPGLNHGWQIQLTGDATANFDTKEALNASRRPVLYITYTN